MTVAIARGRAFEDFAIGDVFHHQPGRTILAADNSWFSLLTMACSPIHIDHHYAAQTEFGRPLVNSSFVLALVTGQSVSDVSLQVFANLGWDEVRLPHPVFEGDTIYARSEVLETRPSKSRPETGLVKIRSTGVNQNEVKVISFLRSMLIYRRGRQPVFIPASERSEP